MTSVLSREFRESMTDRRTGSVWRRSEKEKEHDTRAMNWFLAHCDSHKCVRGTEHARNSNWHDNSLCLECKLNPYEYQEENLTPAEREALLRMEAK